MAHFSARPGGGNIGLMRLGILSIGLALVLAATASAQEGSQDEFYPNTARQQGVGGTVTLECLVNAEGRLGCEVKEESPAHWEFGDAALAMSTHWRVAARTHNGQSTAGGRLRRTLVFQPGPPARILHAPPPHY
jgi:TonB family protein